MSTPTTGVLARPLPAIEPAEPLRRKRLRLPDLRRWISPLVGGHAEVADLIAEYHALGIDESDPAPARGGALPRARPLNGYCGFVTCAHVDELPTEVTPDSSEGCRDCLDAGHHDWAHLRMCLTCGHVGCCDSSPGKHATAHYHAVAHPIMRSIEPNETWRWCFPDGVSV